MKFTSAIIFLSLSACISPTFGKKRKDKADEIPSSLCDSDIQCGGGAYNGEVKLTEDLYCPSASGDCAIILDGEDAVLDCNKYMIHGKRVDDSSLGNGICIRNGASSINCHVQKFGVGINVQNGGEVKDCKVVFNDYEGIRIQNEASSKTKIKISNTYVHDNDGSGIKYFGYDSENSETSIEVNNVKSNHNGGRGMYFAGENVKLQVQVKDSETSNNSGSGIEISFYLAASVDVELDGIISRYNGDFGYQGSGVFLNGNMNMKVKGDVNLYKNGSEGIRALGAAVVVEKQGALNSCGHGTDIDNNGGGTFKGNGYTCTNVNPPGVNPSAVNPPDAPEENQPDTITCDPCPTCPSDDA